jgi:hypothetical protein
MASGASVAGKVTVGVMDKRDSPSAQSRRGVRPTVAPFVAMALASACASGTPFEGSISAAPSAVLQLSWAKAKRTPQGIEVWGQLQQVRCCRYLRGDIDLEAKSARGLSLASTRAGWGEFNPRQLHSAWFRAVLPVAPGTNVSTIEIRFNLNPEERPSRGPNQHGGG